MECRLYVRKMGLWSGYEIARVEVNAGVGQVQSFVRLAMFNTVNRSRSYVFRASVDVYDGRDESQPEVGHNA